MKAGRAWERASRVGREPPNHRRCSQTRYLLSYPFLTFQTQLPYTSNGQTCDTQRVTMNSVKRHNVHLNRLLNINFTRPTARLKCTWDLNLISTYTRKSLYTLTCCKLSPKFDTFHKYYLAAHQISLPPI